MDIDGGQRQLASPQERTTYEGYQYYIAALIAVSVIAITMYLLAKRRQLPFVIQKKPNERDNSRNTNKADGIPDGNSDQDSGKSPVQTPRKKGKDTPHQEEKKLEMVRNQELLCGETPVNGAQLENKPPKKVKSRYLKQLLGECDIIKTVGSPKVYTLPLKKFVVESKSKLRRCTLGEKPTRMMEDKVIMVVGATGAGKTTLINGMINYVLGVRWEDPFRFKLIVDPEEAKLTNQAESQTQWITAYTIYFNEEFRVNYTLTIIDTPGFGDTRGVEQDKLIVKQISNFFHSGGGQGIETLNAIGFVTQATNPRLTPTQRFIFDQVLSLFGKDVGGNIFLMLTFADGKEPPVMSAIAKAEIPHHDNCFKFNNSALFADNKESSALDFESMFWKMGIRSFEVFFTTLNSVEAKSLLFTKEVLLERQNLQTHVEGIHRQLQEGLNNLDALEIETKVLLQHQSDIEKNKDFTYTVHEDSFVHKKLPVGQHTTTCLKCNATCHENCVYADDNDKRKCCAIRNDYCTNCPMKCFWDLHRNTPYKVVSTRRTVEKTSDELKAKYQIAYGNEITAKSMIQKAFENFQAVQFNIIFLSNEIRKSVRRLESIALRPSNMSAVDYFDILIESEQREHKEGWMERVKQLQNAREQAVIMFKAKDADFDPFEEYKERYDKLIQQGKKKEAVVSEVAETVNADKVTLYQTIRSYFTRVFTN